MVAAVGMKGKGTQVAESERLGNSLVWAARQGKEPGITATLLSGKMWKVSDAVSQDKECVGNSWFPQGVC